MTRDGRRLRHHTRAVRGTATNPMTREEVAAKSRELLRPVIGNRRTERLIDHWREQLPIYQALLQQHRAQISTMLPVIDDAIQRRSRDVEALRSRIAPLQARIEAAIRKGDIEQTATIEQLTQLVDDRRDPVQLGAHGTLDLCHLQRGRRGLGHDRAV